ncbi:MAG: GH25 family lysozyme [Prevotella sp.]|nr:GH25 family lysozyme [Prevotella sp.]
MKKSAKGTSRKKGANFETLLSRHPKWVWWLGGFIIVALYIWALWYFFVFSTAFRWQALYGDEDYPDGYEIQGIDISHYQGDIDWRLLRTANINKCPIRFVLIKATEGVTMLDENFEDNFHQAREHGFIRGAYHFFSKRSSAREQAYFFLENVPLEAGDLPPILDVEHKPKDKSVEDFQRDVLTWLHIVENKYHVKPIIYTYYKFKERYLNDERFDDYPYWIAHYYVDVMQYQGPWKFWQHTDAGKVQGIEGPVDFNIYNGSFYDLQQLCLK